MRTEAKENGVRLRDFIDVAVPCHTAFARWLAFEEYPRFMAGVRNVTRRNDSRMHWRAEVNGRLEEWEAEIVENIAPSRLAWRGAREGSVILHPTPWGETRIFLEMDQEPLEPVPDARHAMEAAARRIRADLERFKEWVEHPSG